MKRDAIQTYRTPFTIEEVLEELKFVLWCNASQIALSGPEDLASQYIGFEVEFGPNISGHDYLDQIDLERFTITRTLRIAYDFAFQVGDRGAFDEADWHDLAAFQLGASRGDWEGVTSAFGRPESCLSHVADMAFARLSVMNNNALTIRHLSLLANMTEAAVRTALSAEGIRTEGRPASLPAEKAEAWLRGRRGYVPTTESRSDAARARERLEGPFQDLPLPEGMAHLLTERKLGVGDLARSANVDLDGLEQLVQGKAVVFDIPTLIRISGYLRVEPELFVTRITRHALLGPGESTAPETSPNSGTSPGSS